MNASPEGVSSWLKGDVSCIRVKMGCSMETDCGIMRSKSSLSGPADAGQMPARQVMQLGFEHRGSEREDPIQNPAI